METLTKMKTEIKNVGGVWYICTDGHTKRLGHDFITTEELIEFNEFFKEAKNKKL